MTELNLYIQKITGYSINSVIFNANIFLTSHDAIWFVSYKIL